VFIGCPVWAHPGWVGNFFTRDARRTDYLPQYASVFSTAEGNSTFYGLPAPATVERWSAEAPPHFRFCFKFPQVISHERRLENAMAETEAFLAALAPVRDRLGPCFLQLPATFGPNRLPALADYLGRLPRDLSIAVEVRHRAFFAEGAEERDLDALLRARDADRVIFDTRPLFASPAQDECTLEARRKKPRVPVRFVATGDRPFVRFVGDPAIEANRNVLAEWAVQVARWMAEGRTPYFFTHHPDDTLAPPLARLFHELLRERVPDLPPLPSWPCARRTAEPPRGDSPDGQLSLF
jgi:uncharacterized protein YecE (DUF72 family)